MLRCLPATCLALCLAHAAAAAAPAGTLRIAVVHDVGDAGTQTWHGVAEAAAAYAEGDDARFEVVPLRHRYTEEGLGLDALRRILAARTDPGADPEDLAHLVIGPTDSGIFVALGKHGDLMARAKVPIISPIVTAEVPNDKAGWRFRTNVNVVLRAREVAGFLAQRGPGPVTVLYADSEFGKLAEKAFREFWREDDERLYRSYVYRGVRDSQPIRTLLQERPWAVGVFGSRQTIEDVQSDLRKLNQSWYAYDPLIFSVIDARTICRPGIYFVSLASLPRGPCQDDPTLGQGEPHGLAFDTARIALAIADATPGRPGTDAWQEEFRARFSRALDGRETGFQGLPRIRLAGRENRAPLGVYTVADGEVVAPEPPAASPASRAIGNWFDVRARRFGIAPIVNVLLILGLVGGLTFFDAARWHSGSLGDLPRRWPFLRLMAFNLLLALAVFFVLAETESGPFRWDFLFGALVVAFGYQALLKTTILETPSGQRLGLADIYDRALRRMNDKIMVMRYDLTHEKASFVAQTNSFAFLRDKLRDVYRRAKTPERQQELIRALELELKELPQEDWNRVCAERLLAIMSWSQLQGLRVVPRDIDERHLISPDSILRASRDFVVRNEEARKRLDDQLDGWFQGLDEKREEAERAALQEEEDTASTDAGLTYRRLQYLYAKWTYDLDRIESAGLIPPEFRQEELRRKAELHEPWPRRIRRGLLRAFRSSRDEPASG